MFWTQFLFFLTFQHLLSQLLVSQRKFSGTNPDSELLHCLQLCLIFLSTDPAPFLIQDHTAEKKFKFSLQLSLDKASERPFLADYKIHVTKSVKPEPNQMKGKIQGTTIFIQLQDRCYPPLPPLQINQKNIDLSYMTDLDLFQINLEKVGLSYKTISRSLGLF